MQKGLLMILFLALSVIAPAPAMAETVAAQQPQASQTEAIGKVLGKTIYRHEIEIPKEYRNVDPNLYKKLRSEHIASMNDEASGTPNLDGFLGDETDAGTGDLEFETSPIDESEEPLDEQSSREEFEKSFGLSDKGGAGDADSLDKEIEADSEENFVEDDIATGGVEEIGDESDYGTPEEKSWEREKIVQGEVMRLFAGPLFAEYAKSVEKEIEPKPEEIDAFCKTLTREDKPGSTVTPDIKMMAKSMLGSWKLQTKLYENFGGGRILWQQAGYEAFDAMHNFIEEQQKQGRFEIYDPQLKESLANYWTEPGHSGFLKNDPETVKEFLHPDWKR